MGQNIILVVLSRRNWGILRYNSIFQNFAALFFICLSKHLFTLEFIYQSILFFIFSIFMTGYGYFVNDLSDIDLDRLHNKPNAFQKMSRWKAYLIVGAILMIGCIASLPFLKNFWFLILFLGWIVLSTLYSMPPFRLKETGFPGLVATVLAQQTFPLMLLFATFNYPLNWGSAVFVMYATLRGLSSDVGHQVRDLKNDIKTETLTFVVRHGLQKGTWIYLFSLEFERLALGCVIILLLVELPVLLINQFGLSLSLVWPLAIVYITSLIFTIGRNLILGQQGNLEEYDPYNEERQAKTFDALQLIHHSFPSVIIPLYLSLCMTYYFWPNIIFSLIIVLLFQLHKPDLWIKALKLNLYISHPKL